MSISVTNTRVVWLVRRKEQTLRTADNIQATKKVGIAIWGLMELTTDILVSREEKIGDEKIGLEALPRNAKENISMES